MLSVSEQRCRAEGCVVSDADFVEVFHQRPDSTYVVPPEPVTKSDSDDDEEEEEQEEETDQQSQSSDGY